MAERDRVELQRIRRGGSLRHERSPGGFKSVWLDAAGWSALLGAGLAAGGLVALAGAPITLALPGGVVATWGVLLLLDHLRWRNLHTGIGTTGLDARSGPVIVGRLREMGIEAAFEEIVVGDLDDGSTDVQRNIVCRNADRDAVEAVMREVLAP